MNATVEITPAGRLAGRPAPRRAATGWRKNGRRFLICYLLIAPVIALRVFTAGWPIVSTSITSFQESNPTLGPDRWIGFDNYRHSGN
jgi:ABC-type sugar transport system permease subunit